MLNVVHLFGLWRKNQLVCSQFFEKKDFFKNIYLLASDLRSNQVSILSILLNILQKHPDNSDVFTKVCFAFLPFIFESMSEVILNYI